MTNHSMDTGAFAFISIYPLLKIQQIPFDIIINAVLRTQTAAAAAHILAVQMFNARKIHYISNALNNNMRAHFINTKVNIFARMEISRLVENCREEYVDRGRGRRIREWGGFGERERATTDNEKGY